MKKIFIIMMLSVSLFSAESKKNDIMQHLHKSKLNKQEDKKQGFKCEGKKYCKEMKSCAEAKFYLTQCGLTDIMQHLHKNKFQPKFRVSLNFQA